MYSRGKTKSTSTSEAREIRTVRSPSFFTCKKVSLTECGTIVYGVVTGPLISIIFSWIHLPSSPDLTSGMCSYQLSSKPVQIIRPTTLERKSQPRCRRSKRVYFGHTATSFGKQYIEIPGVCIILLANIIWRSGHAICSSSLLDFSFLHHICRRVFTVLYVTAM